MNGINPNAILANSPEKVHYPDGDGKPMAETGIHVLAMVALIGTLREYYRRRKDVYVIGNIFLYYEEGHPESRRSPDVMIVKGNHHRRSFKTWEEKVVPSVVIEITSDETADEDLGTALHNFGGTGQRNKMSKNCCFPDSFSVTHRCHSDAEEQVSTSRFSITPLPL
jgi:hypothetical protein